MLSWALVGQISVLALVGTVVYVVVQAARGKLPNNNNDKEK